MRIKHSKMSLALFLGLALVMSFPLPSQAWRGGGFGGFHGGFGGGRFGGFSGFHGGGGFDGGFGGGSFHEGAFGGGSWSGAHGGQAAWGPRGAGVAQGPGGSTVARGPYGGGAVQTPSGSTAIWHDSDYDSWNHNVNVSQTYNVSTNGGWGYYGGTTVSPAGAAVVGALAGLAIGTMVASLPANAEPLLVGNQTYYYDGTNYYQPCNGGSDTNYCVVANPNQ